MKKILVGNVFPTALIRARVEIAPSTMEDFHKDVEGNEVASFWGHANTLGVANAFAGVDLTPETERPAIRLDAENHPSLDGVSFDECWLISPDYRPGFRPAIGVEVTSEDITGWQVLKVTWLE